MTATVSNDRTARAVLAAFVAAAALVLLVPYLAWWSRLPDPVANHFDLSGQANGSMGRLANLLACGAITSTGLVILIALAARRSPLPPGLGSYIGFLGGFLATVGALLASAIAFTQRDLDSWQDARLSNVLTGLLLVAATLAGSATSRAGNSLAAEEIHQSVAESNIKLRPDQQAFWTGRTTSRPFQIVAVGFTAAATISIFRAQPATGVGLLVAALAVTTVSIVRVSAGKHGLTITYGLAPWPRTSIPVADITSATPIDVRPMQWGGWGYRGSLRLTKQAAVILRGGPGLHLDLSGNRILVVTVDQPEIAAAVLTTEIARKSHPPTGPLFGS